MAPGTAAECGRARQQRRCPDRARRSRRPSTRCPTRQVGAAHSPPRLRHRHLHRHRHRHRHRVSSGLAGQIKRRLVPARAAHERCGRGMPLPFGGHERRRVISTTEEARLLRDMGATVSVMGDTRPAAEGTSRSLEPGRPPQLSSRHRDLPEVVASLEADRPEPKDPMGPVVPKGSEEADASGPGPRISDPFSPASRPPVSGGPQRR
jgi:hypothetical protein